MRMKNGLAVLFATLWLGSAGVAFSEEIEVLHYWTAGGESKAVGVLKRDMEAEGYTWKDSPIAGGGGQNAMVALKTRVVAGDPPSAVAIRGRSVQEWAEQDVLVNLDPVAANWSANLPPAIDEILKYDGHYVAAPHWIHRVNWMYVNKAMLDEAGGQVPTTWDEFFVVADKMKAAGHTAIAHGGTPYHDAVFFEGIVQSMGVDFYRRAILEGDTEALASPTMVKVFDILRHSQQYFDDAVQGRPWNIAANMVIEGQAGFLFMGDWANGEFANAGKVPGKDYICAPRPGNEGIFTFIADTFVFFKRNGEDEGSKGQMDMASLIETPAYQQEAARFKGAIPALTNASLDGFNDCSKKSAADLKTAAAAGKLVPSQNMGTTDATLGAIRDVVTGFMNSSEDSATAAQKLADAVQAAQ